MGLWGRGGLGGTRASPAQTSKIAPVYLRGSLAAPPAGTPSRRVVRHYMRDGGYHGPFRKKVFFCRTVRGFYPTGECAAVAGGAGAGLPALTVRPDRTVVPSHGNHLEARSHE